MSKARALPDWPRRMKLSFAAAYVDESQSKFLSGVKAGKWPEGSRDGHNTFWYREDLDRVLDRLKPTVKPIDAPGVDEPAGWDDYLNDKI
jgi:hypothetical protein